MIDENQFSQMMKESLSDLKGKVLFVTGPGRSGAVAAVYASYYLDWLSIDWLYARNN